MLGITHGRVGERQDVDAVANLVRRHRARRVSETQCRRPQRSSNNPASLTSRLGATIDVEQNHVRFLGDLILNLWDCGGQDAFMDTYLTTQRSTIFQAVGVLIYVFDVGAHERAEDLAYFKDCCEALRKYSPDARVFLLLHKMDLVGSAERTTFITRRGKELREVEGGSADAVIFGTSIYDESLYKVRRSETVFNWNSRLHRHGRASFTQSYPMQPYSRSTSPALHKSAPRQK